MSDNSTSNRLQPPAGSRSAGNRMWISGTVIAVVAAGIGWQLWRAESGKAAVEPAANSAQSSFFGQPIVRVNGQPIAYEILAKECVELYGKEVLEDVINRTIIQQACAEKGLTVTDAEVNQEIVRISKKFGLAVDQWYGMLQSERGLTPIQYRRNVIWPMLALKKLAGKEVVITNQMMQEAYTDNYGPRVKARMIMLNNLRHAQDVADQLRDDPDNFDALARDMSVEPNSRALGGTIPPIRRFSGAHEEIRKAAFRMTSPGEISGIIQTEINQYVILKFEGRTDPIAHDPKDVQPELHEELVERQVQTMVAETFEDLKESARVDNHLTGETSGPIEQASGVRSAGVETQAPLNLREPAVN